MPSQKNTKKNQALAYADVAFPAAVREVFTYHISSPSVAESIRPGCRVWVQLREAMTIGMVVEVHQNTPSFKTKPVVRLLDDAPVLSEEMLKLTKWMHRFYYAGWGETVQAALPSGLNFNAVKYLTLPEGVEKLPENPVEVAGRSGAELLGELMAEKRYDYREAVKRWGSGISKTVRKLVKLKLVEVWEHPVLRMKPRTETVWNWHPDFDPASFEVTKSRLKWQNGAVFLHDAGLLPATSATLTAFPEVTPFVLSKLESENMIRKSEVEASAPEPDYEHDPEKIIPLNDMQQEVFGRIKEAVHSGAYASFLIYGVTGSGKTEVYIHALKEALGMGKGGLVLVPEIALTPQTVRRFYRVFGPEIAVLHSRLNDRERYDAWQALRNGEKRVAIGPRSAVFAPVRDLGIIIMDEEHDTSYRQADPAPRYHARETALMRASINNAVLVMGSATPSLISLVNATRGKHELLKIPSRHTGATLPQVRIIDLKQYRSAMKGPLSVPLYEAINEAVAGGEQVILLYNRRGFASYMQCLDCGAVPECPNCSVSLTYHKHLEQLRCHYCGFSRRSSAHCFSCGSAGCEPQGSGTQQVEEQLETVLPDMNVLRMDQDTTSAKNAHDRILMAFGNGEADVLIGTQLVAKGLDFPNVTVVGVINADTELAFPSYRSSERMYQLLSQVAGRSGRSQKAGKVFLQTRRPDHYTLKFAREHHYEGFARHELALRKPLLYPPYSRLLTFGFRGKDAMLVEKAAQSFAKCLHALNTGHPILGPVPEMVFKVKNEFRWELTMKLPPDTKTNMIEWIVDNTFNRYAKYRPDSATSVRITVAHEMM